ncbi:hypothetical protein XI06_27280 [Bradyrhizobium sp. CCBAU 11434]|nr:hypothetical protein [Bradyrhizobium sp. CCBAU 11434]
MRGSLMADEYGILRVEIDGAWTPAEFSELFKEIEVLNEIASFGDTEESEDNDRMWLGLNLRFSGRPLRFGPAWTNDEALEIEVEDYYREAVVRRFVTDVAYIPSLHVAAIQYASPGFVDIAGAGRIVGHISKFILGIADRLIALEDRRLAREQTKQKILKQKIENADALLKLGTKVNLDIDAKRQLVRRVLEIDEYFQNQLLDQKITSVREIVSHNDRTEIDDL